MKRYGLLGYPLGHTMSPPVHKRLFELDGISDFDYSLLEISPEDLGDKISDVLSLDGFNITVPHKVEIIRYTDMLADSAKRYNSVNCVVNKDGKHIGCNTDCDGFLRSLEAAGAGLGGRVLLCGCGGAGRMIAIEALRHGAELTISVNPGRECTVDSVKQYAADNNINAPINIVTSDRIKGDFDLLVNASPVGMHPKIDGCPVPEEVIARCGFVFDVVYNPETTKLMRIAKEHGIKTCGGMAMLVWQAAVAHEIWNGASYKDEDIEMLIADMHKLIKEKQ